MLDYCSSWYRAGERIIQSRFQQIIMYGSCYDDNSYYYIMYTDKVCKELARARGRCERHTHLYAG